MDRRKRWRLEHPEKYAAQTELKKAIARGELIPEPCLFCDDPNVQGHHHDYRFPLLVTWLCAWHHHLAHGRAKKRKVAAA